MNGSNLISGLESREGSETIRVSARDDGRPLEPGFVIATPEEVDRACAHASDAFPDYAATSPAHRAAFLDRIAAGIESLGDELIDRASAETGLTPARLIGERTRTCGQLRMFAALLTEGSWVDARIDEAIPDRAPVPKPDLRRMLVPLGPVAVFGASNFPLAYSVAGGDTAAALAAGCPVVVKAHPAHPGTSELVGRAIVAAANDSAMPGGVFSMIHGGEEVSRQLVMNPEIAAVAFTGSLRGGRAIYDLAASRPRPIPVFAEMGSLNPVFLLPHALSARGNDIARGYADSLSLGAGQFCTNPGIVVGIEGSDWDSFLEGAAKKLADVAPAGMLTDQILNSYCDGVNRLKADGRLRQVFLGVSSRLGVEPAVFEAAAEAFIEEPAFSHELFGPAAIAVRCRDLEQLKALAYALIGQLTASVHWEPDDEPFLKTFIPVLNRVAGRIVLNGFPTGVEVCPSMQHGGPYPASTDSRFTSVGTASILRFARPVCYQNFPDALLPAELRQSNPSGIPRIVNWKLT